MYIKLQKVLIANGTVTIRTLYECRSSNKVRGTVGNECRTDTHSLLSALALHGDSRIRCAFVH